MKEFGRECRAAFDPTFLRNGDPREDIHFRFVDRMAVVNARTIGVDRPAVEIQWLFRLENTNPDRQRNEARYLNCLGGTLETLSRKKPILGEWVDESYAREAEAGIRRTKGYGSLKAHQGEPNRIGHVIKGYWTLQNTEVLGQVYGAYKVLNKETGYVARFTELELRFLGIVELLDGLAPIENHNTSQDQSLLEGHHRYTTVAAVRRFFRLSTDNNLQDLASLPFTATAVMELAYASGSISKYYQLSPLSEMRWLPLVIFCDKVPAVDQFGKAKKRCLVNSPEHREDGLAYLVQDLLGQEVRNLYTPQNGKLRRRSGAPKSTRW